MIDKRGKTPHVSAFFSAIFNQVFNKEKYINGSYNKDVQ
jgi:hypothetical protein